MVQACSATCILSFAVLRAGTDESPIDSMDSLDSLLTHLQLQPSTLLLSQAERLNEFTPFPTLPTELRLKIISHALPTYTTIKLDADILVADPSFGLYLTFLPPRKLSWPLTLSFTSKPISKGPSFKTTRQLNLLLVNKECRSHYLEQFPLSLPIGRKVGNPLSYASLTMPTFPFLNPATS
jgi:hypothetical protein